MSIHPIAHRLYLRIKGELTEGLPPEAHPIILNAAGLTEQRLDVSLRMCVKSGMKHRDAERHILNLFLQAKKLAEEGTVLTQAEHEQK